MTEYGAVNLKGKSTWERAEMLIGISHPDFRDDMIRESEKMLSDIENYLMQQEEVVNVSTTLGGSPLRYYLASTSFGPKPNFGNILIEVKEKAYTAEVEERLNRYVRQNYPNMLVRSSLFKLSPAVEAAIEIGFIGENIDTLKNLTEQAMLIMQACPMVTDVRSSWGNMVPVWEPVYSQERGQRLGITRQAVAYALKVATNGLPLGDYREKDLFMPILLKEENYEAGNLDNMRTLPVFSATGSAVPLAQVVDRFDLNYNYNVIKRYNRERVMMAQCDPKRGANTKQAFRKVWEEVQKIEVPPGYRMKFFGEDESQVESNEALAANMPLTFILMFVVLLLLFRTYRKPIVILLMIGLYENKECNCIGRSDRDRTSQRFGSFGSCHSGYEIQNCTRDDGFRYDYTGYVAFIVRCYVRRNGCWHYGWIIGCKFTDHYCFTGDV